MVQMAIGKPHIFTEYNLGRTTAISAGGVDTELQRWERYGIKPYDFIIPYINIKS